MRSLHRAAGHELRHRLASVLAAAMLLLADQSGAGAAMPDMRLHDRPLPLPQFRFEDGDGNERSLADFRGKIVLLNIWATWCVPCRHEMPTLERLQAALGGPDFAVVALSVDRGGVAAVRDFYARLGLRALDVHIDASGQAMRELKVRALPTTLLVDERGREIGRYIGAADWSSPEMIAFLRRRLDARGTETRRAAPSDTLALE